MNDEFLGYRGGFRRIALGVFCNELELLSEHAAFGIDLVGGNFSAVDDIVPAAAKAPVSGCTRPIGMVDCAAAPVIKLNVKAAIAAVWIIMEL